MPTSYAKFNPEKIDIAQKTSKDQEAKKDLSTIHFTLNATATKDKISFDIAFGRHQVGVPKDEPIEATYSRALFEKVLRFIACSDFLDEVEYILNKHPKIVELHNPATARKYKDRLLGICEVGEKRLGKKYIRDHNDPIGGEFAIVRQEKQFISRIVHTEASPPRTSVFSATANGDKPPKNS